MVDRVSTQHPPRFGSDTVSNIIHHRGTECAEFRVFCRICSAAYRLDCARSNHSREALSAQSLKPLTRSLLSALCASVVKHPDLYGSFRIMHHPLDAFAEHRDVEVDKQPDRPSAHFQVCKQLGFVNRLQSLHRFQFH